MFVSPGVRTIIVTMLFLRFHVNFGLPVSAVRYKWKIFRMNHTVRKIVQNLNGRGGFYK